MGKMVENIHFYLENGKMVFTEQFHIERGFCCGNKCRNCGYEPRYIKGNKKLKDGIRIDNTSTNNSTIVP